ncbi:hypothetical protein M2281_004928 [Mesorhizobium soli]|nr:hypothetical protein [Mesorhizobium soli]
MKLIAWAAREIGPLRQSPFRFVATLSEYRRPL